MDRRGRLCGLILPHKLAKFNQDDHGIEVVNGGGPGSAQHRSALQSVRDDKIGSGFTSLTSCAAPGMTVETKPSRAPAPTRD